MLNSWQIFGLDAYVNKLSAKLLSGNTVWLSTFMAEKVRIYIYTVPLVILLERNFSIPIYIGNLFIFFPMYQF